MAQARTGDGFYHFASVNAEIETSILDKLNVPNTVYYIPYRCIIY